MPNRSQQDKIYINFVACLSCNFFLLYIFLFSQGLFDLQLMNILMYLVYIVSVEFLRHIKPGNFIIYLIFAVSSYVTFFICLLGNYLGWNLPESFLNPDYSRFSYQLGIYYFFRHWRIAWNLPHQKPAELDAEKVAEQEAMAKNKAE